MTTPKSTATPMSQLESLIAPHDASRFFDTYWEKQFLHSPGHGLRSFADLFHLENLDELLGQLPEGTDVKTAGGRDAQTRTSGKATLRGGNFGPVYDDFAKGKTLIFDSIHTLWNPVRQLCSDLMGELAMPVHANLYVTPRHAQGFDCHWDGHDVLVVQVQGSKDWTLHELIDAPPRPSASGEAWTAKDTSNQTHLTLNEGDVLYIPRGMPHEARSTDKTSIHLTVGLVGVTWEDLMTAAVQVLADRTPRMRRTLPLRWMTEGAGRAAGDIVAQNAAQLADQEVLMAALDLLAMNVIDHAAARVDGHFAALDQLDEVTLDTRLTRRGGPLVRIQPGEDDVKLHFPGGTITSPSKALWAFSFFAETEAFTVGQIPGWYGDAERLALARQVVKAGMFGIPPPAQKGKAKQASARDVQALPQ